MKSDYQTKKIGDEDVQAKAVSPAKSSEPVKIEYNFPTEGITVEASSLEEAMQKLAEIKSKQQ